MSGGTDAAAGAARIGGALAPDMADDPSHTGLRRRRRCAVRLRRAPDPCLRKGPGRARRRCSGRPQAGCRCLQGTPGFARGHGSARPRQGRLRDHRRTSDRTKGRTPDARPRSGRSRRRGRGAISRPVPAAGGPAKPAASVDAPPTARPPKAADRAPAGGAYRIQLAALRSRSAAEEAWKALLRKHRDLLSRLDTSIRRVDLGAGKGVYFRLQAGSFENQAGARRLCSELAGRKVGCLVVRR